MRRITNRVNGPYAHGQRWRVIIVEIDGTRRHASESEDGPDGFATREKAEEFIEEFRKLQAGRTVGEAIHEYLKAKADRLREASLETLEHRLRGFFRCTAYDASGPAALSDLDGKTAARLVRLRKGEVSLDTLHSEFTVVSYFVDWCIARGWIARNPFEGIELPRGERNRGKPQLRIDEVRRLLALLQADPSPEATAVLVAVLMGCRAHEIVERTVRDLDDGGRLLVIAKSKTRAGVRTLAIPPQLQPRLLALAEGKRPDDRIFTPSEPRKPSEASRHWLHYHTIRFCVAAGLPRVTPHGLRGTFATMAAAASASTIDIAKHVGHADAGATLRAHYFAPGAEQSANASHVAAMLNRPEPEVAQPAQPQPEQQPAQHSDDNANAMAVLTVLAAMTLARGANRIP